MTEQDLAKIKFRCTAHLSLGGGHVLSYESVDYRPVIRMSIFTPYKDGAPDGKGQRAFFVNDKEFDRVKDLLEYLTELENNLKEKMKR